ncbi:MAG: 50S ribosomal protein L4 [Christensenellales bacterium]|jgi:large subunit ribosomal protein L4
MPKVALYNTQGKTVGEIELADAIFGVQVNMDAMHQVVRAHLAARRQGTQSALTRAEVRGGGSKPWRQKGTGRARHGSTRSPQWKKGGVAFAPKPRDYDLKVNKKVKRLAMKSALSSKVLDSELVVLDELSIPQAKTKEMVKVLGSLNAKKALIVLPEISQDILRAANNIPGVKTSTVDTINVYDILKYDLFIITQDAVKVVEEVYA